MPDPRTLASVSERGIGGYTGLLNKTWAVAYDREPLDDPAPGQALLCCARRRGPVTIASDVLAVPPPVSAPRPYALLTGQSSRVRAQGRVPVAGGIRWRA
jgi:hypothetical protein